MRVALPALMSLMLPLAALPAQPPGAGQRMAAQREAMKALERLEGEWRGPAWTLLPDGSRHQMVQTERVGSFLDGTVKVIEGRGYEPDGSVTFNALAVISFDPDRRTYSLRSYAMGYSGDYSVQPKEDGIVWEIPAGSATIRYTAVVKDGRWHEIGERIVPGREPVRFVELNLTRVGDTRWPAGGAVQP